MCAHPARSGPSRKVGPTAAAAGQDVLAAADELDDFVAVAGLEWGSEPVWAGEDLEVAFDGDAAGIEAEFAEQVHHGGAGLRGALLSVYDDGDGGLHQSILLR